MDPIIIKLINWSEEKDVAIKALGGQLQGFDTSTQFVFERSNSNIVEAIIMCHANRLDSFDNKVDKICHRIDMLEHKSLHKYYEWWRAVFAAKQY